MQRPLKFGTRGSKLALTQAELLRSALARSQAWDADALDRATQVVVIRTGGDDAAARGQAGGGKGLFTKEIEEALLRRQIDVAVHSAKDLLAVLPDGLVLSAYLPRQDPRDAYLSADGSSLDGLPPGALFGTSAPRRRAQALRLRPDLRIVPFRGNVDSRLKKLKAGEVAATFLAVAGLNRLGLGREAQMPMAPDVMLPAIAQGAIALETRADDAETRRLLDPLDHRPTHAALAAERGFIAALEGDCRTPIAGLAEWSEDGTLRLRGEVLEPDGRHSVAVDTRARLPVDDVAGAERLGRDAGLDLKAKAGPAYFANS